MEDLFQKRLKKLPVSPKGPIATGIKEYLLSNISPMTLSADRVCFVIGLVPPLVRANFIFSPFLRCKLVSL